MSCSMPAKLKTTGKNIPCVYRTVQDERYGLSLLVYVTLHGLVNGNLSRCSIFKRTAIYQ